MTGSNGHIMLSPKPFKGGDVDDQETALLQNPICLMDCHLVFKPFNIQEVD
jgi:hypothetical protein